MEAHSSLVSFQAQSLLLVFQSPGTPAWGWYRLSAWRNYTDTPTGRSDGGNLSGEVVSSQECQIDNQDWLPQGLCKLEAPAIFYIDIIRQSGFIYFGGIKISTNNSYFDFNNFCLWLLWYIHTCPISACISRVYICEAYVCISYICVCVSHIYVCACISHMCVSHVCMYVVCVFHIF